MKKLFDLPESALRFLQVEQEIFYQDGFETEITLTMNKNVEELSVEGDKQNYSDFVLETHEKIKDEIGRWVVAELHNRGRDFKGILNTSQEMASRFRSKLPKFIRKFISEEAFLETGRMGMVRFRVVYYLDGEGHVRSKNSVDINKAFVKGVLKDEGVAKELGGYIERLFKEKFEVISKEFIWLMSREAV